MAYDRYARVIAWAVHQPWALLPSKLLEFRAFLALKAEGVELTPAEIQARIGTPAPAEPRTAGGIALIPVAGVISHRISMLSEISGGTSTEKLQAQIEAAVDHPDVGTIVLDVNSPGGGVFGVPEVTQVIREARREKPVIAVVNALAASAAYWIASAASEIVATPSAQVGSIGVFALHQDVSRALDAEGLTVSVIGAGKYKTETLPFAPLSEEAREAIQREVDTYYGMFVRDVAQGRKATVAAVRGGYGEGRTVNAQAALDAGMVDRIATLDDVLAQLQSAADVQELTALAQAVEPIAASQPTIASLIDDVAADVADLRKAVEVRKNFTPSTDFQRRRARLTALASRGRA